jgi:hypothetical protein
MTENLVYLCQTKQLICQTEQQACLPDSRRVREQINLIFPAI